TLLSEAKTFPIKAIRPCTMCTEARCCHHRQEYSRSRSASSMGQIRLTLFCRQKGLSRVPRRSLRFWDLSAPEFQTGKHGGNIRHPRDFSNCRRWQAGGERGARPPGVCSVCDEPFPF